MGPNARERLSQCPFVRTSHVFPTGPKLQTAHRFKREPYTSDSCCIKLLWPVEWIHQPYSHYIPTKGIAAAKIEEARRRRRSSGVVYQSSRFLLATKPQRKPTTTIGSDVAPREQTYRYVCSRPLLEAIVLIDMDICPTLTRLLRVKYYWYIRVKNVWAYGTNNVYCTLDEGLKNKSH